MALSRRMLMGLHVAVAVVFASCTFQSTDADALADRLVDAKRRLARTSGAVTAQYNPQGPEPYIVTIVPATATATSVAERLPGEFAHLVAAPRARWPGRTVLAVLRGSEYSAVDYLDDYLDGAEQLLSQKNGGAVLHIVVEAAGGRARVASMN